MEPKDERTRIKKEMLEIGSSLGPDYINIVTSAFPEFNNPKSRTRIRNVKNGITADRRIAEILKTIARQREAGKKELKKLKL